jgi:hypothetical protein
MGDIDDASRNVDDASHGADRYQLRTLETIHEMSFAVFGVFGVESSQIKTKLPRCCFSSCLQGFPSAPSCLKRSSQSSRLSLSLVSSQAKSIASCLSFLSAISPKLLEYLGTVYFCNQDVCTANTNHFQAARILRLGMKKGRCDIPLSLFFPLCI